MKQKENHLPRQEAAGQLVEDFNLQEDAEFFSHATNRVDFIKSLDIDSFTDLTTHINDRMRGFEPRDRRTAGETGSYLRMLKTPDAQDKPEALENGLNAITRYLHESEDSDEQKLKSAGMAVEALIVWVHPFNDGNGRTSRFLSKFIEDGSTDTDQLIAEASDKNARMRMYGEDLRIDNATDLSNEDIILDDDEIDQIKAEQDALPITDGIALSLERLLNDRRLQNSVEVNAKNNLEIRQKALERQSVAA
jgi:hypothetical protein